VRKCELCGNRVAVSVDPDGDKHYIPIAEQEIKRLYRDLENMRKEVRSAFKIANEYRLRLRQLGQE
jgi:hypothetical protein